MTKKYELTSETKVSFGRTLYRIRALLSFGSVKAGDVGGWIEKESNLDQSGEAWVFGSAQVLGSAQVFGSARVKRPLTTATRSDGYTFALLEMDDATHRVTAGCRFFTLEEGRAHWAATRGGTMLGAESLAILDFFAAVIAAEGGK